MIIVAAILSALFTWLFSGSFIHEAMWELSMYIGTQYYCGDVITYACEMKTHGKLAPIILHKGGLILGIITGGGLAGFLYSDALKEHGV